MGLKLSDVSPIASLVKGEGIMEYAGVLPAYLTERRKKRRREEKKIAWPLKKLKRIAWKRSCLALPL